MTRDTGTVSPPVPGLFEPMRTLMSGAGQEAGVATAAPVTEPQWPAVRTTVGEISVPVHRKAPKVTSATAGYLPAGAFWPPTIAKDGVAAIARTAAVIASSVRSFEVWFIPFPNALGKGFLRSLAVADGHHAAHAADEGALAVLAQGDAGVVVVVARAEPGDALPGGDAGPVVERRP